MTTTGGDSSLIANAKKLASKVGHPFRSQGDILAIKQLPKENADFAEIWQSCRAYTMTSFPRGADGVWCIASDG
jgi:hypothetical protein